MNATDPNPPNLNYFCSLCGGPLSGSAIRVRCGQFKDEVAERAKFDIAKIGKRNEGERRESFWCNMLRVIVKKDLWEGPEPDDQYHFDDNSLSELSTGDEPDGGECSNDFEISDGNSTGYIKPYGLTTLISGLGYLDEEPPAGFAIVDPYYYNDDEDDMDDPVTVQVYNGAGDILELEGLESLPVHEFCWGEFKRCVKFWCQDQGIDISGNRNKIGPENPKKWCIDADHFWTFFQLGYWEQTQGEELGMVKWRYGKRIVENHVEGVWKVEKGEGWWLSDPRKDEVSHLLSILRGPAFNGTPSSSQSRTHPVSGAISFCPQSESDIFYKLPRDIALMIFSYLPSISVRNLRLASRPMNSVYLPQAFFRSILVNEYRFLPHSFMMGVENPQRKYTEDWCHILKEINKILNQEGSLKNRQRIHRIISTIVAEMCEKAPRTIREHYKFKIADDDGEEAPVDETWEWISKGGLVGGYVQASTWEGITGMTAWLADGKIAGILVYLNEEEQVTGWAFLVAKVERVEKRVFGVRTARWRELKMHSGMKRLIAIDLAMAKGSRLVGVQFVFQSSTRRWRSDWIGTKLEDECEVGDKEGEGVGYYRLAASYGWINSESTIYGITGLVDHRGIRSIGLLQRSTQELEGINSKNMGMGEEDAVELVNDGEMELEFENEEEYDFPPEETPISGPWKHLPIPLGAVREFGSDAFAAYAHRLAAEVVQLDTVSAVVGWWDEHKLRGLKFEVVDGEDILLGNVGAFGCEHSEFRLHYEDGERIGGAVVFDSLTHGVTIVSFATTKARCGAFFGPRFVGRLRHFKPENCLEKIAALTFAFDIRLKTFTRIGAVRKLVRNGYDTGLSKMLPFEAMDDRGSLWQEIPPDPSEFLIDEDTPRPDNRVQERYHCGVVWIDRPIRKIEVWGDVKGVKFTFEDGTVNYFGAVGKGRYKKIVDYENDESYGKRMRIVEMKWRSEHVMQPMAEVRWDDGGRVNRDLDEEDWMDEANWDYSKTTRLDFRLRPTMSAEAKGKQKVENACNVGGLPTPCGYKISHNSTKEVAELAPVYQSSNCPYYLSQRQSSKRTLRKAKDPLPVHPKFKNCEMKTSPPLPMDSKYEYAFFDADGGEKLESILLYAEIGFWRPFSGLKFKREGKGWSDVLGETGPQTIYFEMKGERVEGVTYVNGSWLSAVAFSTATRSSYFCGKTNIGAVHNILIDDGYIPIGVYLIRNTRENDTQPDGHHGKYRPHQMFGLLLRKALPSDKPLARILQAPVTDNNFCDIGLKCSETGHTWKGDLSLLPPQVNMLPLMSCSTIVQALDQFSRLLDADHRETAVLYERIFVMFEPCKLRRIYVAWKWLEIPMENGRSRRFRVITHVRFKEIDGKPICLLGENWIKFQALQSEELVVDRARINGPAGERIIGVTVIFCPWLAGIKFHTSWGATISMGEPDLEGQRREESEFLEKMNWKDIHRCDVEEGWEVTGIHIDVAKLGSQKDTFCDKWGLIVRPGVTEDKLEDVIVSG